MNEQTPEKSERITPTPSLFAEDGQEMLTCDRCGLRYQQSKSTSSLRLTYCSFLCELGDLGFSIAGLEHMEAAPSTDDDDDDDGNERPRELGEPATIE